MPTQTENDLLPSPAGRRERRRRKPSIPAYVLIGAAALFLVVLLALALTQCNGVGNGGQVPTPSPTPKATPTPVVPVVVATPTPTPTPIPTPTPAPVYDFTRPAPITEAVAADYFADAVFVGDSRTDGLKLYGGVEGADFLEHTGITVFEVGTKKCIRINGEKYTVLEALALKQYKKVYLMLGVNELGYFDDEAFRTEYAGFVDKLRALQPDAVIYLQNLVSINPDKAKANDQPYYVTNEQIIVYNQIIADIAQEKHAVLVDVDAALVDESGVLPREGTTDGVHFTKDYYVKWYEYLKTHTVDTDLYLAGQTAQ